MTNKDKFSNIVDLFVRKSLLDDYAYLLDYAYDLSLSDIYE